MEILNKDTVLITKEQDVVAFRTRVKEYATKAGMGIVNQTKLITAASELVRNLLKYGGGGHIHVEEVSEGREKGVRLTFVDQGPGIENIDLAMQDGYSTGKSLGLGLPGARRLVSKFTIESEVGRGTTVTIIKWKNG